MLKYYSSIKHICIYAFAKKWYTSEGILSPLLFEDGKRKAYKLKARGTM